MADKRYEGTEARNLREGFNANATNVDALRTDLAALLAKLDLDSGVNDADYASLITTTSALNAADKLVS